MKIRWIGLLLAVALLSWAGMERRMLTMRAFGLLESGEVPALLDRVDEGADVRWYDDYFTIELIAPDTLAIGEPRYYQQNYSYLIIGSERALLFDAGPGIRNIRAVAERLTDKAITFLPSHLHYDHVGNSITFDRIALIDVPAIRSRVIDNAFSPSDRQHLGFAEGMEPPTWQVDEWIVPGSQIDLGNRVLKTYYTPGHTNDSVSLFDAANGIVFSGDYLYPGPLYGFLPNSSMGEYLAASAPLIDELPEDVVFFGAHRDAPPGAPKLGYQDLQDLRSALLRLRSGELEGEGFYPQSFVINERLWLLAEPRWLQDWD